MRDEGTEASKAAKDKGIDGIEYMPQHKKAGQPMRKTSLKTTTREWCSINLARLLRRTTQQPPKDERRIPLRSHHEGPLIDPRRGQPYISNTIRTSRYNIYDFLPKQIFFQFSRLANFYFLCVGVPQTIPGVSTTGSFTTILPLLFFVLLIISKEGYDDWKRHRLDRVENARSVTVLRDTKFAPAQTIEDDAAKTISSAADTETTVRWCTVAWRDLKVGDVIKLERDEDIPADIVLLHANGENSMAYIETMALDGETNLKSRQVSAALEGCDSIKGISKCNAEFVIEDPNPDLYRFDGRVTASGKTLPLTLNEVVYRGCTLRNTTCAIGMVINTGEECKIRMNANRRPTPKTPALERVSNRIVLSLVVVMLSLAVGCTMGYRIWKNVYEHAAWYLDELDVPFENIFVGYAIMFNNIIPLALYVSLEIVKLGQMLLLNSDIEMYDEMSDTPARCNTNTILENLGQVGYVFSDKTGTLTENVMKFRKISIAGTTWLHEMDITKMAETAQEEEEDIDGHPNKEKGLTPLVLDSSFEQGMGISLKPIQSRHLSLSPTVASTSGVRRSSSHWRSTGRPDHDQPELNTGDLLEYLRLRPNSPFAKRALQYILALALCHTCLPEVRDGKVEFQASSPDELALVRAAQELGFLVINRTSKSITLRISGPDRAATERTYEVLDVIEFSSKRKRMSIILRCPDKRIWLLMKGADSAIVPRLRTADLAMQKADEVRKSLDLEHELLRKSEAREPRNSFGGRPSLTVRRSIGLSRHSTVIEPSNRPDLARSKSAEVGKMVRSSMDRLGPHLTVRTASFDVKREAREVPVHPRGTLHSVPEKYAFLDDPSISDDSAIFTRCFKHIDDFATEGLRTLLFAHRFLTEDEYRVWKIQYHEAETSLVDRQERIEAAGELIEQSLDLIGASAIEDKLQKGVPETIDRLRRANIKIWMLTGDKRETAINIAHSARICRPGSDIFILDVAKGDLQGQILSIKEDMQLQIETSSSHVRNHTVVVVDGHTLAAIEEPGAANLKHLFYGLIPTVDSVICCRASPAQKSLLVTAIRKALKQAHPALTNPSEAPLTLAIGDGANDLPMILAAHVGIGISGREGLQAARVADYSIAQFRFLARLLLVHGRWNYARTARFVLATFWKEMLFNLPQMLYQRYNGYSGTSLYESWSLTVLNTLFTSLCVIVPGIWEQDLAAETLLAVPELYVYGQRDRGLNVKKFLAWMVAAASEGVLVWFLCWVIYGGMNAVDDGGLFALGNLVFTVNIMWINVKLM